MRSTLNILHEADRVVDGGVDVAARYGVADAEEAIAPLMVAHDRLRPVRKERLVVDFAEVHGAGLQVEVELVDRRRAMLDHDLVRLLFDMAFAVFVEENAGDPVAAPLDP